MRPVAQWQERGPYKSGVVSSILTGTIMVIVKYLCDKCNIVFDVIHSTSNRNTECAFCGSAITQTGKEMTYEVKCDDELGD